ncbi:MFS transporter [Streptosporangium sp. NPDC000396]|uniref:MFS transporter n=1 Tax=Streptosporangium sp. NPDC000396 TaxID=3366185 RepID=UPI0036C91FC4
MTELSQIHAATGRWRMLSALSLGVLVLAANVTMLDFLQLFGLDPEATPMTITWVIYAYPLAFVGVLIPVKARKSVLMSGFAAFGLASLLCAFALQSGGLLICGRAAQGLAAAVALRAGFGLMAAAFPGTQVWRAVAMPAVAILVGLNVGPVLGIVVEQHLLSQWVFLMNVPLAAIVLAAVAVLAPGPARQGVLRTPHGR